MATSVRELGYGAIEIYDKETIGVGSYGKVCKGKCGQLPCAAKLLHDTMFSTNDPGIRKFVEQFEQECRFLRMIEHPNIVQFLGTVKDPRSQRLALLMELMDESLTKFLERSTSPLPYHTQLNICHDVALALAYLHSNNIIHRDLSSNNVLLIGEGSRAKVTDFGMSKLISMNPRMTPLTMCPGTQAYMPPEALITPPRYSNKLDCFSHGVLAIQIVTRQFPNPGNPHSSIQDDLNYPNQRLLRQVSENERRKKDIDLVDPKSPLLPLARRCLKDSDTERPSADELCGRLATLKSDPAYTCSVEQSREHVRTLQQQIQEKESELERVRENHDVELSQCQGNLQKAKEECQVLKQARKDFEDQLMERETVINQLRHQISLIRNPIKPETQEYAQLRWRRGADTVESMASYCGSAIVHNKIVYVSQGHSIYAYTQNKWTAKTPSDYKDFSMAVVYDRLTTIGGWRGPTSAGFTSPPIDELFSLAGDLENSQLKSLGAGTSASMPHTIGSFFQNLLWDETPKSRRDVRSQIVVLPDSSMKWEQILPRMLTARVRPAVVATSTHLVVAGGRTTTSLLSDAEQPEEELLYEPLTEVEVLNLEPLGYWSRASSLPLALHGPHMTLCSESLYISANHVVFSCPLDKLLASCNPPLDENRSSEREIRKGHERGKIGGGENGTEEKSEDPQNGDILEEPWDLISENPTTPASLRRLTPTDQPIQCFNTATRDPEASNSSLHTELGGAGSPSSSGATNPSVGATGPSNSLSIAGPSIVINGPPTPSSAKAWTRLSDIPTKYGATITSIKDHVLAIGGSTARYGGTLTGTVHEYNASTNTWSMLDEASNMTPRSGALVAVLPSNEIVAVGGGREESRESYTTEISIVKFRCRCSCHHTDTTETNGVGYVPNFYD